MTKLVKFNDVTDLRKTLAGEYQKQIENYFGDEHKAREFLSCVVDSVRRVPELMDCTPATVLESFMKMAQLKLMPSGVSGEAYVLPYKNRGVLEAQFQLGYQGIVTLLYRAGAKAITTEIVREKDKFSMDNGRISHTMNPFADRGEPIGAYMIAELQSGGEVHKAMSKDELLAIGEKFSKSWKSEYSPWNPKNDPQLWMWKKTVLKQGAKTLPKNEALNLALAEDNKDSNIHDRMERAQKETSALSMGKLAIQGYDKENNETNNKEGAQTQDQGHSADSNQE